jgi:hypothetical protein
MIPASGRTSAGDIPPASTLLQASRALMRPRVAGFARQGFSARSLLAQTALGPLRDGPRAWSLRLQSHARTAGPGATAGVRA